MSPIELDMREGHLLLRGEIIEIVENNHMEEKLEVSPFDLMGADFVSLL